MHGAGAMRKVGRDLGFTLILSRNQKYSKSTVGIKHFHYNVYREGRLPKGQLIPQIVFQKCVDIFAVLVYVESLLNI